VKQDSADTVRAHVWVKGRVQGVGFRAHVEYYARQIGVTGWVRNVGHDTVETVAEGVRAKLERFIEMVKQGPRSSLIDEARLEWEPVTGEFETFEFRRSM
jgi:acylphosphatase